MEVYEVSSKNNSKVEPLDQFLILVKIVRSQIKVEMAEIKIIESLLTLKRIFIPNAS